VTVLLAFLAGLLIGSFLNVCIHRWPDELSVVQPRSHCPLCISQIAWYDNIPLLSYVLLKGRCRCCRTPIPLRYPLVELLNAIIYAGLAYKLGPQPEALKSALFASMMLVAIFSDYEQYILPDEITIGGLVIGLALSPFFLLGRGVSTIIWLIAEREPEAWVASLTESAVSALVFGGVLLGVRELYYRVRDIDGLGLGDVKLMAMIAAFWGSGMALLVLIVGSVAGAASGLLLALLGGRRWDHELPYGTYLGAAAVIAVVWGDQILAWYWQAVLPAGA